MKVIRAYVVFVIVFSCALRASCEPGSVRSLRIGGRQSTSLGKLVAWKTGEGNSSQVTLEWLMKGVKHHQNIQLPTPWYCDGYEDESYRPVGIQFQISNEPGLMIVANRQSGVYDVRSPIFFRFHRAAWRRIASNPAQSEFTDFGSCYINNGRLYSWDYEMTDHKGHADPQRYRLRVFSISRARVSLQSSKMTRKEYDSIRDSKDHVVAPSSQIRHKEDPMHEFGLRWKWWGDV